MLTIKLPYETSQADLKIINDYRRIQSSVIRYSFKRLNEDLSKVALNKDLKTKFTLGSWFINSGIVKAAALKTSNDKKKIFGGKFLFNLRRLGKITKEQWQEKRLLPLRSEGESPQRGNRHFKLDIENQTVIFKPKRGIKIKLILPKLRKTYLKHLTSLQQLAQNKEIPYTVELTDKFIYLSFELNEVKRLKSVIKRSFTRNKVRAKAKEQLSRIELKSNNENRILGIDMNPNYLGYSILEFDKADKFKIIKKEYFDFKELNKNSTDKKYSANKKKHEMIEAVKHIVKLASHFKVSKIAIEDLNFKPGNKGHGKMFNRLTLNVWHRNLILHQLQKRTDEIGIELVTVNAAYSSTVGNVLFGEVRTPDSIAASVEIARRGFKKYTKNWFYPEMPSKEFLQNRWKKDVKVFGKTWKELHNQIKEFRLSYRFPHDEAFALAVLRHKSHKSLLKRASFELNNFKLV
jgi:IS605 OrfB family transposase